jgi:hypothetical protein
MPAILASNRPPSPFQGEGRGEVLAYANNQHFLDSALPCGNNPPYRMTMKVF